ncbi:MAG: HEPN family nuclease [Thermomicrobiales bacterium]
MMRQHELDAWDLCLIFPGSADQQFTRGPESELSRNAIPARKVSKGVGATYGGGMTRIRPDDAMHEVMRRTLLNLDFIAVHKSPAGPYEVTQLVNSFAGAMIYPWEKQRYNALAHYKQIDLAEARLKGWPVLEKELDTDVEPANYHVMLGYIRNAFAHGNIEFISNKDVIGALRIWNCEFREPKKRNWGAIVTIRDIEVFLMFFCDLASGSQMDRPISYPEIYAYAAD